MILIGQLAEDCEGQCEVGAAGEVFEHEIAGFREARVHPVGKASPGRTEA